MWKKALAVFGKLKEGIQKTREKFTSKLRDLLSFRRRIDDELIEELESVMIGADMGVETTSRLVNELKMAYRERRIEETTQVMDFLREWLTREMSQAEFGITGMEDGIPPPVVYLICGVNGSGKTTSIAKLANFFIKHGKRVLLSASDTFRAAAIEQLEIWARRIGADVVRHQHGADPGAVAFDAAERAVARGYDVLIVDTAGRLHTKKNLMMELSKIRNVLARKIPGAPHETLLVLDATTGQNAISQAKLFNEATNVTGIFLAKLDGTAKGGIVVAIKEQLDIPVKFIGIGEKPDDIDLFNPASFVNALLD